MSQGSLELREYHQKVLKNSALMILLYMVLVFGALFVYFYVPVLIDLGRFLMGRDDLSYPLVLKADYVIFNPKSSGWSFVIYTILSRFYINLFCIQFCVTDLLLATILFYTGSYMESITLRLQLLSQATDSEPLSEFAAVEKLKGIISDHGKAIGIVKSIDNIFNVTIITQVILFSISFCFVMFNVTSVSIPYAGEARLEWVTNNSPSA